MNIFCPYFFDRVLICENFSFLFGKINGNVYFCTPIVRDGIKSGDVGFPPAGPK